MDIFFIALLFVGGIAFFLYFLFGVTFYLIEPVFLRIAGRPFYVHFYIRQRALSLAERSHLSQVAFYRKLSPKRRKYFEHRVARFLKRYRFHGKGGLIITDEMRILVAASYVSLTFGFRNFIISAFRDILLYPDEYPSTLSGDIHRGEFNPRAKVVVFSWNHFREGLVHESDNLNLGIHEFAHALHFHGMQRSDTAAANFAVWYRRIMEEIHHPPNAKRLIESDYFRIYAYTNRYEFLAVILEHFFETPQQFRQEFPELYGHVRHMINLDAAAVRYQA